MCRNSFLSMIFLFACGFFWLGSAAFQPSLNPSTEDAFALTATRQMDDFSLTETSIVATFTALADPNCTVDVSYYIFDYSYENGENWEENPAIQDYQEAEACAFALPFWSHQISISTMDFPSNDIEDFVWRLPDYPPKNDKIVIHVRISFANYGPITFADFSYQQAVSAYESGLTGQALLDALAIPSTESVILRQLPYIHTVRQTMTASGTANPESLSFELTLTSVIGTATAATSTPDPFALTATSIIATATAHAATQSP